MRRTLFAPAGHLLNRALVAGVCLALLSPLRSAAAQDSARAPAVLPDTFTGFGPLYFASGRHSLPSDAVPLLERVLRWLHVNPGMRFRFEGNSDRRGSDEANLVISRRRAESAVRWLVAKGISRSRLDVVAHGETRPLCGEFDTSCAHLERRVDIRIAAFGANSVVRPREELPPR